MSENATTVMQDQVDAVTERSKDLEKRWQEIENHLFRAYDALTSFNVEELDKQIREKYPKTKDDDGYADFNELVGCLEYETAWQLLDEFVGEDDGNIEFWRHMAKAGGLMINEGDDI